MASNGGGIFDPGTRSQMTPSLIVDDKCVVQKPSLLLSQLTGPQVPAKNDLFGTQTSAARLKALLSAPPQATIDPKLLPPTPGLPMGHKDKITANELAELRALRADPALAKTVSGRPFELNSDVTAIYQAGEGRWDTHGGALRDLFWDRSPKQIRAIELAYKDRIGSDLVGELDKEFGENDRKFYDSIRKGDRIGAAAAELTEAAQGGKDPARASKVLRRLEPEEIRQTKLRFERLDPKDRTLEQALIPALTNKRNPNKQLALQALLAGDKDKADGIGLGHQLARKDGAAVVEKMREMGPEAVARVDRSSFKGSMGASLVKLEGTDRDQAKALLAGNLPRADAAKARDAVDGWAGIDKDKLFDALSPNIDDPVQRRDYMRKLETEYDQLYTKPLRQEIARLGGEDRDRAETLLAEGRLSSEKRLQYALTGSEVDGMEAADAITKLGPDRARQAFRQATVSKDHPQGLDLTKEVDRRLDGRGEFEARIALRGEPKTAEEKVALAKERAQFEDPPNKLGTAISDNLTDPVATVVQWGFAESGGAFTETDEIMNTNVERSEYALGQLHRAKASGDTQMQSHWDQRVGELTGYNKGDVEVFRGEKDGVAEGAALAATTAVAITATVVTAGSAAPVTTGVLFTAAGAGTNIAVKSGVQGEAYDNNDAVKDGLQGAADVGGAILGAKLAGPLAAKMPTRVAAVTTEGIVNGAIGAGVSGGTREALEGGTAEEVFKAATDSAIIGGAIGGALAVPLDYVGQKLSNALKGEGPAASAEARAAAAEAQSVRGGAGETPAGPVKGAVEPHPVVEAPVGKVNVPEGPRYVTDSDPLKARLAELPPVPESPTPAQFEVANQARTEAFLAEDAVRVKLNEARAAGDVDAIAQLQGESDKLRLAYREVDNAYQDLTRQKSAVESASRNRRYVLEEHADKLTAQAAQEGRITAEAAQDPNVRKAVAFQLYQDVKGEVQLLNNDVTALAPNVPKKGGGFQKLVTSEGVDANILAARTLIKDPPTIEIGGHQVKVYTLGGGEARQLADLEATRDALQRMQKSAPNSLQDIKEVHFTSQLNTKVGVGPDGLPRIEEAGMGFVPTPGVDNPHLTPDQSDVVVVRRQPNESNQPLLEAKARAREEINTQQLKAVNEGGGYGWSDEQIQDWAKVRVHDFELADSQRRGTLFHETSHITDKRLGTGDLYASETGKFGPFGGNGSVGPDRAPVKGTFSRTEPTDYVSFYAQDHVGYKLPREDFAETAGFIMEFSNLKDKPPLGPFTPALEAKIRGAGKMLGTPEDQIEAILNHYGRAG
ncbi:MAG: hypothetical protein AB7S38_16965 [Vulcanimicrobiota bacterium]